jgi:hypothetical protein
MGKKNETVIERRYRRGSRSLIRQEKFDEAKDKSQTQSRSQQTTRSRKV